MARSERVIPAIRRTSSEGRIPLVFQEVQSKVTMMVAASLVNRRRSDGCAREAGGSDGLLRGLEKGVGVAQTYSLPEPVDGKEINRENLNDEELDILAGLLRVSPRHS